MWAFFFGKQKIHFQCGGAGPFSVDGMLCLVNSGCARVFSLLNRVKYDCSLISFSASWHLNSFFNFCELFILCSCSFHFLNSLFQNFSELFRCAATVFPRNYFAAIHLRDIPSSLTSTASQVGMAAWLVSVLLRWRFGCLAWRWSPVLWPAKFFNLVAATFSHCSVIFVCPCPPCTIRVCTSNSNSWMPSMRDSPVKKEGLKSSVVGCELLRGS